MNNRGRIYNIPTMRVSTGNLENLNSISDVSYGFIRYDTSYHNLEIYEENGWKDVVINDKPEIDISGKIVVNDVSINKHLSVLDASFSGVIDFPTGKTNVGYNNTASGFKSSALGYINIADASYSSAVGYRNTASDVSSSAFGHNNTASGNNSSALGYNNAANGKNSVAVGYLNTASDEFSSAVGRKNSASIQSNAFGRDNIASGVLSSAYGNNNTADASYSSAFGYSNNVYGERSVAVGYNNDASGDYSSAFGRWNDASGERSSAFGYNNTASDISSSAFGYSNTASGINSSAFGCSNDASGIRSSAFGYDNTASGKYSSAVGYNNTASDRSSSAFGFYNSTSGIQSNAVGYLNDASGNYSNAFGYHNDVSGTHSSAFGYANIVSGSHSSAFGYNNTASGEGSVAIGYKAKASGGKMYFGINGCETAETQIYFDNSAGKMRLNCPSDISLAGNIYQNGNLFEGGGGGGGSGQDASFNNIGAFLGNNINFLSDVSFNGAVELVNAPIVLAGRSAGDVTGTNEVINFNVVNYNQSVFLHAVNGISRFTAPSGYPGYYLFTYTGLGDQNRTSPNTRWLLNGNAFDWAAGHTSSSGTFLGFSTQVIIYLSVGDYVQIKKQSGNINHSIFGTSQLHSTITAVYLFS